jgi:DNA-binding NarL/FixJ family response regulator
VKVVTRQTAIPRQRQSRPRLAALLVSAESEHRRAWSDYLRGVGIGRVLEASGAQDAVARGRMATEHGVCVLEAAPQDGSTLHAIRELRRQGWDRLVLVSPKGDAKTVRLALASHIRNMIVTVNAGAPHMGAVSSDGSAPKNLELSDREIQVVQLVANGNTNRSVGEVLNLSALTVKSHLSRIGRKLGTGDRAQIVATCMRAGLIG